MKDIFDKIKKNRGPLGKHAKESHGRLCDCPLLCHIYDILLDCERDRKQARLPVSPALGQTMGPSGLLSNVHRLHRAWVPSVREILGAGHSWCEREDRFAHNFLPPRQAVVPCHSSNTGACWHGSILLCIVDKPVAPTALRQRDEFNWLMIFKMLGNIYMYVTV